MKPACVLELERLLGVKLYNMRGVWVESATAIGAPEHVIARAAQMGTLGFLAERIDFELTETATRLKALRTEGFKLQFN